ncbi:MAG: hypothetical protein JWQ78_2032 [Sediminibacterium sp.]|nr:hypothetical protein [Sediminibacterium sp.]
MAKQIISFLLLSMLLLHAPAQTGTQKNGIPAFTLQLTDGTVFSYKDLPQNKPFMLVYFAPECDHCRVFTKKLVDRMGELRKKEIVFVSYFPVESLRKFSREFGLGKFRNVKVGTEGNAFVVPAYFKIGKFPFTALYNDHGQLTRIFREEPALQDLVDR